MARTLSPVSFDDIRFLSHLVETRPRSVAAGAEAIRALLEAERVACGEAEGNPVTYPPPRLARMLTRLTHEFGGPPLEWRAGRSAPTISAVARRTAAVHRAHVKALDAAKCDPVVSAGPAAAMLLGLVGASHGLAIGRSALVRTRDALAALDLCEIDIALLHRSRLGNQHAAIERRFHMQTLLPWRPVLLTSVGAGKTIHPQFEPGSLGDELQTLRGPLPIANDQALNWKVESFMVAVELARRSAVRVVIPDIYAPAPTATMRTEPLSEGKADAMVAVCRHEDRDRYRPLFEPESWRALAAAK